MSIKRMQADQNARYALQFDLECARTRFSQAL